MTLNNSEYLEHQLKRWTRPDAHRFVRPDWRRFVRPGFERDHPFALYERKYRADQPRVPAGDPAGGQWTADASGSGLLAASSIVFGNTQPQILVLAAWPSNGPPEIPKDRPSTSAERTRIQRLVAAFVAGRNAVFVPLAFTARWLLNEQANILTSGDSPKTLNELQDAVASRRPGYEIHHIVEQTPAAKEGYLRSQIDDRENLVRVPTLRHRAINEWYSTNNEDFGGRSPREYLRGKSWKEKREIGLFALRKFGVLKP